MGSTFTAVKMAAEMSTFGLKYYGEFSSKHFGIRWRVEIEQRDYDGSRPASSSSSMVCLR